MNISQDELLINTVRMLSVDAIEKANSGHPGLCLGAAPMAATLFTKFLRHVPKNPDFVNRDRFILSAGHGSMLLYSLLHLFGYNVTQADMASFRQFGSKTPGHPEYGVTAGVEVSTGPLGQGIANAVGFALAERILAKKFNKEGLNLVDHYTYALCGDGCMMEGIESEAASIAGTQKLGKLIVLYDSNKITIEGSTDLAFTEDVGKRHEAQGWHVVRVNDGNDIEEISAALTLAKAETEKPSLVIVNTIIGYGSPVAGSSKSHGAPLGAGGVSATRKALSWKLKPFEVPTEVTEYVKTVTIERLNKFEAAYNKIAKEYKNKYPEDFAEYQAFLKRDIDPEQVQLPDFNPKGEATRNVSGSILNAYCSKYPFIYGGSADLAPSNMTFIADSGDVAPDDTGRNIHFGIREHAMAAICNGMYLHGGIMPFCSTFMIFSDYMRNSMRMSALMDIPVTYILSHDSIGVGEDGPTHQPIEQLANLRCVPNLYVFRPCDGRETAAAYAFAFTASAPTVIVCSRQKLPLIKTSSTDDAMFGGYIVSKESGDKLDVILIATGSEVSLAIEAQKAMRQEGIEARVVSMPCCELFDIQTLKYRESVLPSAVTARVAIEAASSQSWYKYIGLSGETVCIDMFGKSAPPNILFDLYGFDTENIIKQAKKSIRAATKASQVLAEIEKAAAEEETEVEQ